jgi:O-succinylbenzoic acid--CoA ligase
VSIPAWLPAAAVRAPEREALRTRHGSVSYAELDTRAARAAHELAARGVEPGQRVAIALPPGAAFAEALHGCLRLGAVAMPIDPRLKAAERAARLATAATVVNRPLEGRGGGDGGLPDDHDPVAPAVVVHTSGTTGEPRPVELTYGNWESSARASAARLGLDPAERWLCALPVSHVSGLSILLRSAIYATTAVVHERFDPVAVGQALARDHVTIVSLVPTMLARLLEAGARPGPSLRCVLVGGGPLPAELADRAAAAGFPLAQTYGLTEACSQVTTSEIGAPHTAGRPLDGIRVRVAGDGEILVVGPTVAPAAVQADGFLHTGDVGELDEAGRLRVTGRKTEMLVTGGENVAPAEIEAVLESHPAVAEAAVHGRSDPEWGEAVVATVVVRAGVEVAPEDLRAHCRRRLAGFKVPKAIEFADALPRTPSGKLRRELLR